MIFLPDEIKKEISLSREDLEKLLKVSSIVYELILRTSQRLDVLVVEYTRLSGTAEA